MKKLNTNAKSGFTIIEVVLVLAVAGLIFLMVFIALPAMQRSQRDTRRTSDMGRVQAALLNWQNNHTNKLPGNGACNVSMEDGTFSDNTDACKFIKDYMNSAGTAGVGTVAEANTFQDPSGSYYTLEVTTPYHRSSNPSTVPGTSNSKDVKLKAGSKTNGATIDDTLGSGTGTVFDQHVMFVIPGATCDEDEAIPANKSDFAILYRMEGQGIKCTASGS